MSPITTVMLATSSSRRLTLAMHAISDGLTSPITATTTTAPSVACGRSLNTEPRNDAAAIASPDSHQLAELRARAGTDGSPRSARTRRRAGHAEEATDDGGEPVGDELLVVVDGSVHPATGHRRRATAIVSR